MRIKPRSVFRKNFYFASKRIYKLFNKIPKKQISPHKLDGRTVIILHNPKAAGSTLKHLLGVKGTTHMMPRHGIRQKTWRNVYSVVAVRHPFDRFVSGYSYHVLKGAKTSMATEYGPSLFELSPFEYLGLAEHYPEALGHQTNWTHYPDIEKPYADLILKTEDSATWVETLSKTGLPVVSEIVWRNPSRDAETTVAETLGLDDEELRDLEERVYDYYRRDYEAFGYDRALP